MLSPEFEAAYKAAKSQEERDTILQIAGDWWEERGDLARAALCRGKGPMELIWVPAGKFRMGSPKTEQGRYPREAQVSVTLTQGFWIGKYPVTQKQWCEMMNSSIQDQAELMKYPLYGEGPNHPMYYVNWSEAMAYCQKLTEQEQKAGRLDPKMKYQPPTEAQWEYACRAGSTTRFYFGDDPTELPKHAWFAENSQEQTHPVGQKQPNAWNIHDMQGNVWEWCLDTWSSQLPGGIDPIVAKPQENDRAFRGGGWDDTALNCRSAYRNGLDATKRDGSLGFRCVLV